MSVFRDDLGLGNVLQNVQKNVLSMGSVKNSKTSDVQDSQEIQKPGNAEDLEKVDLTSTTQKKQEVTIDPLEKIQEDKNLLETADNSLSSIKESLKNIDSSLKERLDSNFDESKTGDLTASVQENLKNIKDTIDNTSFNGINPLDNSSDKSRTDDENSSIINTLSSFKDDAANSLNLGNIDEISLTDQKTTEEFQKKVQDQIAYIEKKHNEYLEFEDKLIDKVDSIIQFDSKTNNELPETVDTKQLKDVAVKSISKNTEIAKKAQIPHLDEKVILGLLSISRS